MVRYPNVKFVLISPKELRVPDYIYNDVLKPSGCQYVKTTSLEEAMPQLDVLYMTRIQRERFADPNEYRRLKDSYILTEEKMALGKPSLAVLHPLPRVNEIALEVDDDPRAAYFEQAQNGVYVRMALIMTLLGLTGKPLADKPADAAELVELRCQNPRCITGVEEGIKHLFRRAPNGTLRCIYCEQEA